MTDSEIRGLEINVAKASGWHITCRREPDSWAIWHEKYGKSGEAAGDWRNAFTIYAPKYLRDSDAFLQALEYLVDTNDEKDWFNISISKFNEKFYVRGIKRGSSSEKVISEGDTLQIAVCKAICEIRKAIL